MSKLAPPARRRRQSEIPCILYAPRVIQSEPTRRLWRLCTLRRPLLPSAFFPAAPRHLVDTGRIPGDSPERARNHPRSEVASSRALPRRRRFDAPLLSYHLGTGAGPSGRARNTAGGWGRTRTGGGMFARRKWRLRSLPRARRSSRGRSVVCARTGIARAALCASLERAPILGRARVSLKEG